VFSVAEVLDDYLTTDAMRPVIEITMPYYERSTTCTRLRSEEGDSSAV